MPLVPARSTAAAHGSLVSLDTETTGVDLHHGAKPFLVTVCEEGKDPVHWEWPVDPLTRQPQIPTGDVQEIAAQIKSWVSEKRRFAFQNAKFDFSALKTVGIDLAALGVWPLVQDTLMAGHLLASNQPHDLTSMVLAYLRQDIQPFEDKLEKVVTEARKIVKKRLPEWRIAKERLEEMPSVKSGSKRDEDKPWKNDCWLPRALIEHWDAAGERWYADPSLKDWPTVLAEYADSDSFFTLKLWQKMEIELKRRGLWRIYQERMKVLPATHEIEWHGVTASKKRLVQLRDEYVEGSQSAERVCVNLAASYCVAGAGDGESLFDAEQVPYQLKLPKSGNNKSLLEFVFNVMKVPAVVWTDSGAPSFNKDAMDQYEFLLPGKSKELHFIRTLRGKRQRDTAVTYMNGYEKFGVAGPDKDWLLLHPNLNPTGTGTLRFNSYNPNSQNVSKKEGFNLRYCFGPAPGREWFSFDGKNLERRLPAYEAEEEAIIELLERPDDPPYFGSEHALVAHLLFPKEFESCKDDKGNLDGRIFKKRFAATLYDKTKRFNFAMQYQCGVTKADATSGIPGSHTRFKQRFAKQEALNQKYVHFANKHGYVETMPDKTVDPTRGYPIWCSRTESGRVLPTVPLNYHVQGTACWWMMKAMIRVHEFFAGLNAGKTFAGKKWLGGYHLVLQVHDELAADFPKGPTTNGEPQYAYNLPIAKEVQRLMELGGDDVGIPTPVSVSFHPVSYAEELSPC